MRTGLYLLIGGYCAWMYVGVRVALRLLIRASILAEDVSESVSLVLGAASL